MEIGIYTFAETRFDPATGRQLGVGERVRHLLEEIELADRVGLDVFGVGEHHRPDYSVSAPAVILAAAAARTERIRLTSAVSVLSSDDPVRVFQDFATIDLISGGRAEIMVGRGSFTESFPLFGQDLSDYDDLFDEKLDLLLRVRESERVTWSGHHRPAIHDRPVYPRPVQDPLPVWVAVGGTPPSVVRAARSGLPMALAIIGGSTVRFKPVVDLYREVAARAGHDPAPPVSINSHGFLADDSRRAADLAFPPFADTMTRIGRERGWPPVTRRQFEAERGPGGALFVGNPEQVAEKIPPPARALRARPIPDPAHGGPHGARRRPAGHRAPGHRGGADGTPRDGGTGRVLKAGGGASIQGPSDPGTPAPEGRRPPLSRPVLRRAGPRISASAS